MALAATVTGVRLWSCRTTGTAIAELAASGPPRVTVAFPDVVTLTEGWELVTARTAGRAGTVTTGAGRAVLAARADPSVTAVPVPALTPAAG